MSQRSLLDVLLWGYPPAAEMIDPRWPAFLQQAGGLHLSLWITALALAIGLPLGVLLALWRGDGGTPVRRLLGAPPAVLIVLVRATPVLLLALLAAYLPYRLSGIRAPVQVWAVAAFALYAAVYAAETVRAGLRAVEPRWIEAGRALGLDGGAVLWRIRLPIAVRAMLPALAGVVVTVFKDTSVLVVVGAGELMTTARQAQAAVPGGYLTVLVLALALYAALAWAGGRLVAWLERSCGRSAGSADASG